MLHIDAMQPRELSINPSGLGGCVKHEKPDVLIGTSQGRMNQRIVCSCVGGINTVVR